MINDFKIDLGLKVSSEWKAEPKYICRQCGDVAKIHPQTNNIWGCLPCGMTTSAVSVCFRPSTDFDYPEAARVIGLHLDEFCDEEVPYPAMIAAASRRASAEIVRLRRLVLAARHLIIAAHGSEDGPTSWKETRDDWLELTKDITLP